MRFALKRGLLVTAALLLPLAIQQRTATATAPEAAPAVEDPSYSFAVAPDFLNQDVGDVRRERGWDKGDPNSWTPQLEQSVDHVLDEIESHDPASLLIPGDLVQGHWGIDGLDTGIFGPTRTTKEKVESLRRAGNFYHSQNVARFRDHGLTVHAAVGDHDVGDNPWNGGAGSRHADDLRFKRHHVKEFRELFAQHYTRTATGAPRYANRPVGSAWQDSAYAVHLSPDVLLVTLDEFDAGRDTMRLRVVDKQLAWLRATLTTARLAGTKWIVVQGHMPILTPVRTRSSSGLGVEGGPRSALWQTMVDGGVDLYLAGEVHDTTMTQQDGITQITTGGLLFKGEATYMTADVYDDHMEFAVHEFEGVRPSHVAPIWQGDRMKTTGDVSYPHPSEVVGTLTLTEDGTALGSTGKLVEYR